MKSETASEMSYRIWKWTVINRKSEKEYEKESETKTWNLKQNLKQNVKQNLNSGTESETQRLKVVKECFDQVG